MRAPSHPIFRVLSLAMIAAAITTLVALRRPVCDDADGFAATGGTYVGIGLGAALALLFVLRKRWSLAGTLSAAALVGLGARGAWWTLDYARCVVADDLPADCPGLMCLFAGGRTHEIATTDGLLRTALRATMIIAVIVVLGCLVEIANRRAEQRARS